MQLRKQGVNLEQKDDAEGFLGITLGWDKETGLMEMKQVGLVDHFINTLVLDDVMAESKYTPPE